MYVEILQAKFNQQWVYTNTQPAIIQQCAPQWNKRMDAISRMNRPLHLYSRRELDDSLYPLQTWARYGTFEVPERGTKEFQVVDDAVNWIHNKRTCLTKGDKPQKNGDIMTIWIGLFYWSGETPKGFGNNILKVYDETIKVKGEKYYWVDTLAFPPDISKINPKNHPEYFAHLNFVTRKNVIFKTGTTGDNTMAINISRGGVLINKKYVKRA